MEKEKNVLLRRAKVLDTPSMNFATIEFDNGVKQKISSYSPHSKGHTEHLQKGDSVIAIFLKNAFEYTLSGVRKHVLKTIIYPGDKDYADYLELEKNPRSKEEHPVEIVFQKLKQK